MYSWLCMHTQNFVLVELFSEQFYIQIHMKVDKTNQYRLAWRQIKEKKIED